MLEAIRQTVSIEFMEALQPMVVLWVFAGVSTSLSFFYLLSRVIRHWRLYQAGTDPHRWTYLFGPAEEVGMPLLGSHRGFGKRGSPPENSDAAFEAATQMGIDCIETDVIMTADGVPIIRHGPTAALAGRPDLLLKKMTLAELRALNFSDYLNEKPALNEEPAATVPGVEMDTAWTGFMTLEEFLAKYADRVMINLELKRWSLVDWRFERKVARVLKPYLEKGARIFCSSFNPFSLLRMRHYLPEVCLGMLWRDDLNWFARNRSLMFLTRPDFIHPHEKRIDADLLAYAHEKGYRIHTWVVNDAARFAELREMGVRMILTDDVASGMHWVGREIAIPAANTPTQSMGNRLPRAM